MPSVPPAATAPAARRSVYPNRRISGIATLPIVAAVATLDPETAANPPHATIVAIASPPRRCPRNELAASYSSFESRAWLMKFPISTNIGSTDRP